MSPRRVLKWLCLEKRRRRGEGGQKSIKEAWRERMPCPWIKQWLFSWSSQHGRLKKKKNTSTYSYIQHRQMVISSKIQVQGGMQGNCRRHSEEGRFGWASENWQAFCRQMLGPAMKITPDKVMARSERELGQEWMDSLVHADVQQTFF